MNESRIQSEDKLCFKDICLHIGMWGILILGFLTICVAVPIMALSL